MANTAKSNIILIGFMGSGKTVIGRTLARMLDYDFADTDEEIKEVTGMQLTQLFRKHGEIRFRSEEKLVVQKLAKRDKLVIAYGGSLTPAEENLQLLAANGWIALLSADTSVISARLKRKNTRLLVNGKLSDADIAAEVAKWEGSFAKYANFRLDSGSMSVDEAAQILSEQYRAREIAE